jgi:hypothetical protein
VENIRRTRAPHKPGSRAGRRRAPGETAGRRDARTRAARAPHAAPAFVYPAAAFVYPAAAAVTSPAPRRPERRSAYADACTALIMSNIGMYIATTMPPMMTPMTTIMIGSSTEVSAATALSTSSS